MRLFEIILPVTLLIRRIYPKRWNIPFPPIVLVVQLLFEGYRWQMVPLYLYTLFEVAFALWESRHPMENRARSVWGWNNLLGGLLLVAGITLPALFPIPKIPSPTGPFAVGTATFHLTDPSRPDPYAPDSSSLRELMVQIWYPADTQGQEPVPWMTDIEIVAPAISEWIDMPAFFLDHLKYAVTASYPDIPISSSQARFPVLIFSHGFGGFRAQNTYQMQELASHGYIVLAPEHTYASVITVFPDGRVAEHNPNTLPDGVLETEYDRAAQQLVVQWTADLQFVLDTLALMDEMEPVLRDRLDLTRIGFLGHSTGGGATVQVCALDLRCKAGLGMDAWLVPVADTVIENGPQQPFLFLYSELWPKPKNMALYERLYGTMGSPVARFTITGTAHYDFTDLPALSPLAPYIGLKGPLNGSRVQEIIDTYTLAFFDSVLKGEPSILLSGNSEIYSEVIFVEGK